VCTRWGHVPLGGCCQCLSMPELQHWFPPVQNERQSLESEAGSLVEYASRLQAQSAELAASHAELEELKVGVVEGGGRPGEVGYTHRWL
jgi:hypothetical protein